MDLIHQLSAEALAVDPREETFFKRMACGEYPRASLKILAERTGDLVYGFPAQLRKLEHAVQDEEAKRLMRENLDEEVGRDRDGVVHAERSHLALLRRFARAVGSTGTKAEEPRTRSWLDTLCEEGRWLEALAFFGVGVEMNVPRTYRMLVPLLRERYAIEDPALEFFQVHITADVDHGSRAAEIIARHASDPSPVLAAARRGAAAWWQLYRACDRGMRAVVS